MGQAEVPEGLAAMPAGPALAAALHGLALPQVPNDRVLAVLTAQYRQLCHEQARMMAVLTEVGRCTGRPEPGLAVRAEEPERYGPDETRAALRWTRNAAEYEHDLAEAVVRGMPELFEAWLAGTVDRPRVSVFHRYLTGLSAEQIHRICRVAVPRAPKLTTGQLAHLLRRMVIAVDPDAAARWYRQGVLDRNVVAYPAPDGTVTVSANGLPADEAEAACERIQQLATAAKRAGHPGLIGQIRCDLFLGLLDGRFHHMTVEQVIATLIREYRPSGPASEEPDTRRPHDSPGTGPGPGDLGHPEVRDPHGSDPTSGDPEVGDTSGSEADDGNPSSSDPGGDPGSSDPGGGDLGGGDPSGDDLGGDDPGGDDPGGRDPGGDPGSSDPGGRDPGSGDPGSGDPGSGDPGGSDPSSSDPESGRPGDGCPPTVGPTTAASTVAAPAAAAAAALTAAGRTAAGPTGGPGSPGEPADDRVGIEIRIGLATLLGRDDHPAEIPGLGLLIAPAARRRVLLQARAEWRFAITSPDGALIGEGLTRRRPAGMRRTGPRGGIVELHIPVMLLRELHADRAACGGWADVVADIAAQQAGADEHRADLDSRPGDRLPGTALRRHTEIRDRGCIFAGVCRRPARSAEQDHTHDHADGGATVRINLGPLCGHDHHVKHRAGWTVTQPEPGTFVWRSPLGGEYTGRGEFLLPDLPDPAPAELPTWPDTPTRTDDGPILRRPPPQVPAPPPAPAPPPPREYPDEPPF